MAQEPQESIGQIGLPQVTNCIYDASKKCGYPDRLKTSPNPNVFVISSSEFKGLVNWFREIFKKHIRTEQNSEFNIIYFTDSNTSDFCNNVCLPIQESWLCLAIIKEEQIPQFIDRKGIPVISSFILRLNPNVFFEVGLALAWKKDLIFYLGSNQELPSDWNNLAKWILREQSVFLSSEESLVLKNKIKEIIEKNPFIGHSLKWVNKDE